MSVLVTGGTGFVGGAVVLALMEDGEKVRAEQSNGTGNRDFLSGNPHA